MAKKRLIDGYAEDGWHMVLPDGPEVQGLKSALTAAQARIEELERMVVWVTQNGAVHMRHGRLHLLEWMTDGVESFKCLEIDGTPASILAAVAKAMPK